MNVRVKIIQAAITGSLLAPLVGIGAASAVAAPASAQTVVYGFGNHCPTGKWGKPAVRPSRAWFNLACEDGIRSIRWTYWRRTSAKGDGKHLMFNGTGFTPQPATITLSRVRVHDGRKYFAHLVIKWTTKHGSHHQETYNWKHTNLGWYWE
jgi:hypothetical protein